MATALSMITRAMRLAGVIGKGETPDSDESADGLVALNAMLESWSIDRLFAYYIVSETLTMVSGDGSYTMGSSGDLNTTRPTQLDDSCFITVDGIDLPLSLITEQQYASIVLKTVETNVPIVLYPEYGYPLVTLKFWPVPSVSMTASIKSWKQLQQFTDLTTALSMPPGSQRAIEFSLAEEFGPEFGATIPRKVEQIAAAARRSLKRINLASQMPIMQTGIPNRIRPALNIYTGGV